MIKDIMSKFFTKDDKIIKEKKIAIRGNIDYYGLTKWWLNEFNEEERNTIREKYKPLGCDKNYCIDKGLPEAIYIGCTRYNFLDNIYCAFMQMKDDSIRFKFYNKSLEDERTVYNDTSDIIGRHIYYHEQIKFYYANREKENHFDLAIEYCQKQIHISKQVKKAWLIKNFNDPQLPGHFGFKQLAIIYEKQGEYEEALELTKRCLEEGWNNKDSKKRIDRLEKKLKNKDN